jgi:hypothetical protein
MSCYEWTHGQIVLPSAEVSRVWTALVDAVNADSQDKYDKAQALWKGLTRKQQTDSEAYRQAVWEHEYNLNLPYVRKGEKPRRAKKTDYQWPTKATTTLRDDDLSISLDRQTRTIRYDVGENNHARDHADASPLGQAWHRVISTVKWTHGTGGVLLGNDEYNRESGEDYAGGGGSYVVAAYGYIGAKEAPGHVREFQTPKGWVHVVLKAGRYGPKAEFKPGRQPQSTARLSSGYGYSGYIYR